MAASRVWKVVFVAGCHYHLDRTAALLTIMSGLNLGLLIHVREDRSHLVYRCFFNWYSNTAWSSQVSILILNFFRVDSLVIKIVKSSNDSLSSITVSFHLQLIIFWAIIRVGFATTHQLLHQVSLVNRIHWAVSKRHRLVPTAHVFVLIFIAAIPKFHNFF